MQRMKGIVMQQSEQSGKLYSIQHREMQVKHLLHPKLTFCFFKGKKIPTKNKIKKQTLKAQWEHEFSNLQYTLDRQKLGRRDRTYKAVVNRAELIFQTGSAFKFFGTQRSIPNLLSMLLYTNKTKLFPVAVTKLLFHVHTA